jgi:hypothetical protein
MLSRIIGLLSLLGVFALVAPAHAQKARSDAAAALSIVYAWHDGEREQAAWLNPALIAEFGVQSELESGVKRVQPAAQAEPGSRGIARIWRVGGDGEQVMRQARAANPAGKYSPVFNDGADGSGRKRALPGGIIVAFKSDWTEAQVIAWTAQQGLPIASKLGIGPNVYVLNTDAGLAALTAANRIRAGGEVVSAQPNWWVEVTTR